MGSGPRLGVAPMMQADSNRFYDGVPVFDRFAGIADPSRYQPLPDRIQRSQPRLDQDFGNVGAGDDNDWVAVAA